MLHHIVLLILMKTAREPELRELASELKQVDWKQLGIRLDIPYDILETINKENAISESRKLSVMLQHWLNNYDNPSWDKIIEALLRLGKYAQVVARIESRTNPLGKVLSYFGRGFTYLSATRFDVKINS